MISFWLKWAEEECQFKVSTNTKKNILKIFNRFQLISILYKIVSSGVCVIDDRLVFVLQYVKQTLSEIRTIGGSKWYSNYHFKEKFCNLFIFYGGSVGRSINSSLNFKQWVEVVKSHLLSSSEHHHFELKSKHIYNPSFFIAPNLISIFSTALALKQPHLSSSLLSYLFQVFSTFYANLLDETRFFFSLS